jgi:hypothetical protein
MRPLSKATQVTVARFAKTLRVQLLRSSLSCGQNKTERLLFQNKDQTALSIWQHWLRICPSCGKEFGLGGAMIRRNRLAERMVAALKK